MSHYYEHENESFGPRWMQDELDKHGRYLSNYERATEFSASENLMGLQPGDKIVAQDSSIYTITKITKKSVHAHSGESKFKASHRFVSKYFKMKWEAPK